MAVRFVTDAPAVSARWTLRSPNLAMPHMPATGVSGLDLYAREGDRWYWAGVGVPPQFPDNTSTLATDLRPVRREYLLYLPLYNGVEKVAVGLPEGAKLEAAPPPRAGGGKPMVFYGTSIVQGGCASRAGMGYPEIMGRMLHCRTLNLGFSGNGPMELELAHLLGELDAAVYVLDCLPNMTLEQVPERAQPFVQILRRARPETPVVLVENIMYQRAPLQDPSKWVHTPKNAELRSAYERLKASGVGGLHYVTCERLLGDDTLGTVDGVHPTDVGFMRMAEAIAPAVRPLL
jgi:hypothetical protein